MCGCGGVNGDECVAVATAKNTEQATIGGRSDVLAIGGESGSNDRAVMREWANKSLSGRYAPNAHFVFVSPGGQPG